MHFKCEQNPEGAMISSSGIKTRRIPDVSPTECLWTDWFPQVDQLRRGASGRRWEGWFYSNIWNVHFFYFSSHLSFSSHKEEGFSANNKNSHRTHQLFRVGMFEKKTMKGRTRRDSSSHPGGRNHVLSIVPPPRPRSRSLPLPDPGIRPRIQNWIPPWIQVCEFLMWKGTDFHKWTSGKRGQAAEEGKDDFLKHLEC